MGLSIVGRLALAHVVSFVALLFVAIVALLFAQQQFDLVATVMMGLVLPEVLIASGTVSGWLIFAFAIFSVFAEQRLPTTRSGTFHRRAQLATFMVAMLSISVEIWVITSRGHNPIANVALGVTLCFLFGHSVVKQSRGKS